VGLCDPFGKKLTKLVWGSGQSGGHGMAWLAGDPYRNGWSVWGGVSAIKS